MRRILTVGLALLAVACDVGGGAEYDEPGFDAEVAIDGELVAENEEIADSWWGGDGQVVHLTLDSWVNNGSIVHRLHCGEGSPNGWGGCSCGPVAGMYQYPSGDPFFDGISPNYCLPCTWTDGICALPATAPPSGAEIEYEIEFSKLWFGPLQLQHSYAEDGETKLIDGSWDLMSACTVGDCSYEPGSINFATLASYDDGTGMKIASAEDLTICVQGSCP